jgi:hypothetical protein
MGSETMTAGLKRVPKVIYIGVFLDEAQRKKLLAAVPARHSKLHADHVTLVFQPSPEELEKYTLGSEVELEVAGEAFDEKGQAVLVVLKGGVASKNAHPHITISTAEGTKPVYSNTLFEKMTGFHVLSEPLVLVGTVDTYPSAVKA